ncbi:hypothetical protein X802_01865 [Thermococcus guaymasensis DSM 11113]|uniref:Uncharacterized protein n=1 Tax=Thermococcus guaymasensis DSM 11113 TaxID=1432656 RepID=A0A0X1KN35_9EURY|nr:hypothetical protein X802_01865 [Thermococcus guaymasensis DSM 11113]
MRKRKFQAFDFGDEVVLVPIEDGVELRGILKLDKFARKKGKDSGGA